MQQAALFCCLVLSHKCVSFYLKLFRVNFITLSLSDEALYYFSHSHPTPLTSSQIFTILYSKLLFVYILHSFLFLHSFQLPSRQSILSISFRSYTFTYFSSISIRSFSIPILISPSLRKEKYGNEKFIKIVNASIPSIRTVRAVTYKQLIAMLRVLLRT